MALTTDAKTLTLDGGLAVLNAAVAEAKRIGQPMCISVVDTGGNLLAFGRMDGSKALSVISTRNKAVTAALSNEPTGRRARRRRAAGNAGAGEQMDQPHRRHPDPGWTTSCSARWRLVRGAASRT